jgi:hypothetical protein
MNSKYGKSLFQIKTLLGLLVLSLLVSFQNCSKAHLTSEGNSIGESSSTPQQVDTKGSDMPTDVALGDVPSNFTNSPRITYSAANSIGGIAVASHQVQIIKTSDGSVLGAWADHKSGSEVVGLNLAPMTQYSVLVRAVNILGNQGPVTVAVTWTSAPDPCLGSPAPGTTCAGGAIYLGSLSPGAMSGSGTDKYMTTPGGCGEIPAGQILGSGASAYPSADFTPTCSGTDALKKFWNNGTASFSALSTLLYIQTIGIGYGDTNTDQYYGSTNTSYIVKIISPIDGGYHAAAHYCDRLVYGGYNDWYLPNRYELNLMNTNKASIPGLNVSTAFYWSSTEYSGSGAWIQRFSDGYQNGVFKYDVNFVRCVRRY